MTIHKLGFLNLFPSLEIEKYISQLMREVDFIEYKPRDNYVSGLLRG